MHDGRARNHACLTAVFLVLASGTAGADPARAPPHCHNLHEHNAHEADAAEAAEHAAPDKPQLYFRPFCRRSRYVTNPSAPCWE
jgi:hypothetical protein